MRDNTYCEKYAENTGERAACYHGFNSLFYYDCLGPGHESYDWLITARRDACLDGNNRNK